MEHSSLRSVKRQQLLSATAAFVLFLICLEAAAGVERASIAAVPSKLRCSPKVLNDTDVLNIDMDVRHAGELAIVRPDGEYFFVAQRFEGKATVRAIPSDIFRGIRTLRISPKTFVAHRWREGAPDYELVFTQSGTYKIILGEPLETDVGIGQEVCEISFLKKSAK
jgi:hypothetical protein